MKPTRASATHRRHTAFRRGLIATVILGLLLVIPLSLEKVNAHLRVADAPISTATISGRLAVFDDVWQTIYERYYDPSFKGVDWVGTREIFRRAAAAANATPELYDVLRKMIASLGDVHTRIYSPEDKFDWWSPRFVSLGMSVREVEGRPVVVSVEANSEPAHAGVRPGDLIETIDDVPVDALMRKRLATEVLPPGTALRNRLITTLLDGSRESSIKIGWKRKNDTIRTASFTHHIVERSLGFHVKQDSKGILVIDLEVFTRPIVVQLMNGIARKIPGAHGLILDLRKNGGGDAEAMAELAALFLDSGFNLGTFTDRNGVSFQLSVPKKSTLAAAPLVHTNLPMIVLTDERTSSAAEILAASLQAAGRAKIIGSDTCRCVLAIRSRHTLPDGGVLDVSEFDYRTGNGVRLEGRGIKPDEPIALSRNDLYNHRDAALEAALQLLIKKFNR